MNKKTYKKIQNRLYREIKHRIEAEQKAAAMAATKLPRAITQTDYRNIETIAVKCRIPADLPLRDNRVVEFMERKMASEIARKLYEAGYIKFQNRQDPVVPDLTRIEARLDVLKPSAVTMK